MRKWTVILAAVLMAASCTTKVRLEDAAYLPVAKVVCGTDWSAIDPDDELVSEDMPIKVTVAATRVVREDHLVADGIYTNVIADPDTLEFVPGEYQTLLYTAVPRNAYVYNNQDEFSQNSQVSLRGICAQLPGLSKQWLNTTFAGFYRPLFTGGMSPVKPAAPLFTSQIRLNLLDGDQTLVFQPQQLAQNIHFKVRIKAGEKLKPGKVVSNITGVPFIAELFSGYVQVDTLGQTFFNMTKTGENEEEGAIYEGAVSVLGIMPPVRGDVKTGPGLLKVCIEAGAMKRKAVMIINLKKYLEELEPALMEYTNVEGYYRKGMRSTAYIDIKEIILLESSEATGENPIVDWIDPDDGETQEIYDGDNTEEEGD